MASNPFSLEGKIALVTGANTGLGQGIAVALAEAGADIAAAGIVEVPLGEIRVGDVVVVLPHEICPVDGVVVAACSPKTSPSRMWS